MTREEKLALSGVLLDITSALAKLHIAVRAVEVGAPPEEVQRAHEVTTEYIHRAFDSGLKFSKLLHSEATNGERG